jgi:hypothetical protein
VRIDNCIQEAFLLRQHVVGVFFDLEKAYDRVWRRKVLNTLHDWGLRGNLPFFIQNFLAERIFKVKIGQHLSEWYTQDNGVPQGSVLSVTLFAVAINDIVDCVKYPVIGSLFVDDFAVFCRASNLNSAARLTQLTLNNLHKWTQRNGFKISREKTKCLHFHRIRGQHIPPPLHLGGRNLPYVESVRF